MKHVPPEDFGSPQAQRARPFGFLGWAIIVLVSTALVSATLAINLGRVWE